MCRCFGWEVVVVQLGSSLSSVEGMVNLETNLAILHQGPEREHGKTSQRFECQNSFPDRSDDKETPDKNEAPPREQYEIKVVVYSIPCECGRVYIGETGRTLKQRIGEHKRAVKNQDKNNGIGVHILQTGHEIKWEDAVVTHREQHWTKWKAKEGGTQHQGQTR